jgi:fumarate reductase subunit C
MSPMPLDSKRITILLIGIGVMVLGFFVMTLDKEPFGFGFLGITLGPIMVLIGVITPIFALFNFKK